MAEEMQDGELHSTFCSLSSFQMKWMYIEEWPHSLFLTLQVPWWTIPTTVGGSSQMAQTGNPQAEVH